MPISMYHFPRQELTLCPQLRMGSQPCIGIQPGARFTAWSVDALSATMYEQFTQNDVPKSAYWCNRTSPQCHIRQG